MEKILKISFLFILLIFSFIGLYNILENKNIINLNKFEINEINTSIQNNENKIINLNTDNEKIDLNENSVFFSEKLTPKTISENTQTIIMKSEDGKIYLINLENSLILDGYLIEKENNNLKIFDLN